MPITPFNNENILEFGEQMTRLNDAALRLLEIMTDAVQANEQVSGKTEPARRRMPQELAHREGFSDFVPN